MSVRWQRCQGVRRLKNADDAAVIDSDAAVLVLPIADATSTTRSVGATKYTPLATAADAASTVQSASVSASTK